MAAVKRTRESIPPARVPIQERDELTVRFAGDSGDGMQLAGAQFANASTRADNYVYTLADFPAEIRAPVGALAGVSAFQVHFSSRPIHTPGDRLNALVAMNPAALKTHSADVEKGGLVIVNSDAFTVDELQKAGYRTSPLADDSLKHFRVLALPLSQLNQEAVARIKLSALERDRCRNFFALGLVYRLFDRPLEATLDWIRVKFAKNPAVLEANSRSLKAGYAYGETQTGAAAHFRVARAKLPPGHYRKLTGTEGLALGLAAAAQVTKLPLIFASCPSHPAIDLLHRMAELQAYDVRCPQAEDDMAALGMALGASFGGAIGVTATSGPGLSLQAEGLGLAVMAELPCVVIDLQRGGPSTGMPAKTEQADLLAALFGRHGECPLVVLAPASPGDCFAMAYEAVRLAIQHMTPVVLLGDVYLTIAAETWRIPDVSALPPIQPSRPEPPNGQSGQAPFLPYERDRRFSRPWAVPGTPDLEHRIGGLEKEAATGHVSYDPSNHEEMVQLRAKKIAFVADEIPELAVSGPASGDLLVLGWGSTEGAILEAVQACRRKGLSAAAAHLRYLNPLPKNTLAVLQRYKAVLVAELNSGQLSLLLRAHFPIVPLGLFKVQGRPFLVQEIESRIEEILA